MPDGVIELHVILVCARPARLLRATVPVAPAAAGSLQAIDDCLLPKVTGDKRKRCLRNKDLLETLEVMGELLLDWSRAIGGEQRVAGAETVDHCGSDMDALFAIYEVVLEKNPRYASKRLCAFSQDKFAERMWHVALRVSALKCCWLPAFSKERERFCRPRRRRSPVSPRRTPRLDLPPRPPARTLAPTLAPGAICPRTRRSSTEQTRMQTTNDNWHFCLTRLFYYN